MNKQVELAGDKAHSHALFFNPLVAGDGSVMFVGGAYDDQWLRTPVGWRIIERVQETAWTFGLPELRAEGDDTDG